ncbi:MAG: rhodanese-like domain-containing protein [Bauldia sp.]
MSGNPRASYAGDISATEAWRILRESLQATLIDVRTQAEWAYVGVPLLEGAGKSPVFIEWQSYPSMAIAGGFVAQLLDELAKRGVAKSAPLLFICRSGSRSRSAAIALAAEGYSQCFNVEGGFEGPRNEEGHRGETEGWKAEGLPWVQS